MIQKDLPFPPAEDGPANPIRDLAAIFSKLNEEFFDGAIKARIAWGRGAGARAKRRFARRRQMTLGSYCRRKNLIRIHPGLDRDGIPLFFIEAVVFHEMCHEVAGEERAGKTRRVHTARFRELERKNPLFEKARAWGKANAKYILSASLT